MLTDGTQTEIIICKAQMGVRTGEAYTNRNQRRQVDVEVEDWVATGTSKMLGGDVEFRMTREPALLRSWVMAGVAGRESEGDFPGEAQFAMRYQVTTPAGTLKGLTGVATGPISAFPPAPGDIFRIEKVLQVGNLTVAPVACAHANIESLVVNPMG
jgi:hypothetical protein